MHKPPKLAPYLIVKGGLAAIKFYEDALDAETERVMMAEDGKRILHAALDINDSIVYLSDEFSEYPSAAISPETAGKASVMIHIELKKPKHVDALVKQAVEHGAEVVMPVEDAFWGDRYGQIRDPFGHVWSIGAAIKGKKDEGGEPETHSVSTIQMPEPPSQEGAGKRRKKKSG